MTRNEVDARQGGRRRNDPVSQHTRAMRSRLRLAVLATFVFGLVIASLGAVVAKSPQQRDEIRAADRVAQRFDRAVDNSVAAAAGELKSQHDADQDGYPA